MIAIGVTATPVFVRLTRGQVLGAKVEDYVGMSVLLDSFWHQPITGERLQAAALVGAG